MVIQMGLKEFLVKRLLFMVVTLIIVITLNFAIPRVMPGTPITHLMVDARLPPEVREALVKRFKMDESVFQQYVSYVTHLLQGDMGISFSHYPRQVSTVLMERLPWTLILIGTSTTLSTLLGLFLGVISAWRHGQKTDVAIQTTGLALWSMPIYWLGMILLYFLGFHFGLFPLGGATSPRLGYPSGWEYAKDVLWHLVLPVATMTLGGFASNTVIMRGSMLEVVEEDYVTTAEAKGLGERRVMWGHAARNAMLPMVTVIALNLAGIVGGAVFTETVFSFPGVGRLIYDAVLAHDYPLLQGSFLIIAVTVLLANLFADIVYAYLDPRIKY
jgi:ABC-type dipeptide/oligopeptide/nickel transport system permease component